jgi:hypothetical protein
MWLKGMGKRLLGWDGLRWLRWKQIHYRNASQRQRDLSSWQKKYRPKRIILFRACENSVLSNLERHQEQQRERVWIYQDAFRTFGRGDKMTEEACPFARLNDRQSIMICKHPQFGEYALCAGILKALGCPRVLELSRR